MKAETRDIFFLALVLSVLGVIALTISAPLDCSWRRDLGKNLFAFSLEVLILILLVNTLLKRRERRRREAVSRPYAQFFVDQLRGASERLVSVEDDVLSQDVRGLLGYSSRIAGAAADLRDTMTATKELGSLDLGWGLPRLLSEHLAASGRLQIALQALALALQEEAPARVIRAKAGEAHGPLEEWKKSVSVLTQQLSNRVLGGERDA